MDSILASSMSLMNRLRFKQKFGLILLLFSVPLVLTSLYITHSLHKEINVLKEERLGLQYINQIRKPVEFLQQHRGTTAAYLNGADNMYDTVLAKRELVNQQLQLLLDLDKQIGKGLQTEQQLRQIMSQWEQIKQETLLGTAAESFSKHNTMVIGLLDLKVHVADEANLSYDNKLDSYYLVKVIKDNLPLMIDTMGKARALSSSLAATKKWTPEKFTTLSVYIEQITHLNYLNEKALEKAIKYNPELVQLL